MEKFVFDSFCNHVGTGKMKRYLRFLIVLALGVPVLFGCTLGPQEFGTLEGRVTIGPLVPAIQVGEVQPTPHPEVYTSREIVIFEQNGKTEFTRIQIDANGNYRAELPVGTYVVDINHGGIDTAADLPKEIVISSQEVTRLDIDIDTGIR